jgi:hypothetical protein
VGGEAGQHGQHQPASCRGGIELLRHAAHPDAVLLQLRYSIQDQALAEQKTGFCRRSTKTIHFGGSRIGGLL